jgi:transposase InsO family protein
MAWNERKALDQRKKFIELWQSGDHAVAELCRQFEISRPTAYKYIARFAQQGEAGLADRSRAPHHSPQAIAPDVAAELIALRERFPRWGPHFLRERLERDRPEVNWPAPSSIGELLKRTGLVAARKKRRTTPAYTAPLAHAGAANEVWCTDFKGWFVLGDGTRCDPLTATDAFSRYVLRVRAVEKSDTPHVRAIFEAMFREYGMPVAIRSDNGAPFASRAPGGLSRLSMWWLKLGIRHERIEPGCPQQNGRHERMHRTLKAETASPPQFNWRRQQDCFRRFEHEFNFVRPHQALEYRTPSELYVRSPRAYPSRLPDLAYPDGVQFRRISQKGDLKWKSERLFVSEVLAREMVGLLELEEGFDVYYGPLKIGHLDARQLRFLPTPAVRKRRPKTIPKKEVL